MKKWTAIAFVLLMLFVCACAEDAAKEEEFYSAPDDLCFHQHPACSGRNDLELIADTTGLFPCHICADDPVSHEIPEAFTLGDIVVIRMPDKWMNERPDIGTVFASWDKECYAGSEAEAVISKYLHGADYRNFLNRSGFPTYTYYPSIYGTTEYSQRHIGDSWYIVTHLPATDTATDSEGMPVTFAAQRTKDTWYGYLRFFGGRMWQLDGLTYFYTPAEWGDTDYSMPTNAMSDTPVFEDKQGKITINIFAHEAFYLCVMDGVSGPYISDSLTVLLDGMPIDIYAEEHHGKLCFMLTEAEAYRIQNGSIIKLIDGDYDTYDFERSNYAVINGGDRWEVMNIVGVANQNGVELLPERFYRVERYGNVFFCTMTNGKDAQLPDGMYVYDFTKSSEPLFVYSEPNANIYLEHAWDDAFLLEWFGDQHRFVLCDMHTGEILKELYYRFGKPVKYNDALNTGYVYTDGNSERICWIQGGTATLTDNHMNEIAEFTDCTAFLPLTWKGENGLFLLVYGSDAWQLPVYSALFKHGFDAGDYYLYFGEHEIDDPWDEYEMSYEEYLDYMDSKISDITFALVNENGEFVTDAPFTYIRVIDEKQVEIGNRDGMRMIVETEW